MSNAEVVSSTPDESEAPMYEMTVELSVIESLGINLYSNAAAVLSELVANAYDADASKVTIDWQHDEETADGAIVVVTDDGCGMSPHQLNDRFLKAGYKKRATEGSHSPRWRRPFMGRKGIGKLSVFSLASVVRVYSKVEGQPANGLEIDVDGLLESIKTGGSYYPNPVEVPSVYDRRGTTLVLSSLKSKRAGITAAALRKRVARRFDVLSATPPGQGGFSIEVNGKQVTWEDRRDLATLQFIWEFGAQEISGENLPAKVERFVIEDDVIDASKGWKVKGWIGTARKPNDLVQDTDAGSLQNIIILARKRPIQEGIVEQLNFNGIFANYVTGQIEADFLDQDDLDDIATSDRQRLIEDDERVVKLRSFLRKAFVKVSSDWSDVRKQPALQKTISEVPAIEAWLDGLDEYQRGPAKKMVATISTLEFEGDSPTAQRNTLLRSGILAFERIAMRKSVTDLEQLSTVSAENLLPILGAQGNYEASLWVDILRTRVEAIAKLQELTELNEKEAVLQKHIFEKLWLLDPSWERATGDQHMEISLNKIDPGLFPTDNRGDVITGRMDVKYRTLSSRHVIVELKRYGVKTHLEDLATQGRKYHQAMVSVLKQRNRSDEARNIEVYFVVGSEPPLREWYDGYSETQEQYRASQLRGIGGRVFLYDQLIDQARNQYLEYLNASEKAKSFEELFDELGDSTVA